MGYGMLLWLVQDSPSLGQPRQVGLRLGEEGDSNYSLKGPQLNNLET